MTKLGITEELFSAIRAVFEQHKKIERAVVFGSRAKGTFKPYSDIDIALFGAPDFLYAEKIASELEELSSLLTFDCVSYKDISNAALRQHIDHVGVVVYERCEG